MLFGAGMDDGKPGIAPTYGWSIVSAPPGGDGLFSAPDSAGIDTLVETGVAGTYQLRLTMDDGAADEGNEDAEEYSGERPRRRSAWAGWYV